MLPRYKLVAGALRHLSGWKPDAPDHRDLRMPAPTTALPPKTDLRALCPRVRDQGQIGACSANASCESLEFLERKGQADRLFSRLFLYYYARAADGALPDEDSGVRIRSALKVLANIGVPYEDTWPYQSPETRFSIQPSNSAMQEAAQHKILFYYRCSNLLTVKASLAQGFPAVFGFSVPDNMISGRCKNDGLVYYPDRHEGFQGAHSALAVGYDDSLAVGSQRGAVLAQNSWGPNWGQQGYFWLPYAFFVPTDPDSGSALATDCWTIRRATE